MYKMEIDIEKVGLSGVGANEMFVPDFGEESGRLHR
jgi:hypothetical protein